MPSASILLAPSPVPPSAGFRQSTHHVWCGSPIQVGSRFHLFASRWPKDTGFPQGYMAHSEIVRAVSDTAVGPYAFAEVILPRRGPAFWDGNMTHNPSIYRDRDRFVLFYNANREPNGIRKVGYATAPSIEGPWIRNDEPIPLSDDANNPAALFADEGSVLLMFRDRTLNVGIARAPALEGPWTVHSFDLFPDIKLEDFYLWRDASGVHMICEDNRAQVSGHDRWGVHFRSPDGIHDWAPADPLLAYTHTIQWTDGTSTTMERRERPQLLFDAEGHPTHLATGCLFEGDAWNVIQPVRPASSQPGQSRLQI